MVKKVRKFNYKKDLKKEWKKKKEKLNPQVNADVIKSFWSTNKSVEANYRDLGLSIDPNRTLEIPKAKDVLQKHKPAVEAMSIEEAKRQAERAAVQLGQKGPKNPRLASQAIKHMEDLAGKKVEKVYNLNEDDILYCIYMIEKYGEDYDRMARDYKNHYQETPAQIRRKIGLFKQMKYKYKEYLDKKKAGVDFLSTLDESF